MAADWTIKQHDRLPSIQATFSSAGAPVDLTSATAVKFIMRLATGGTPKVNAAAVIATPTAGVVRYDWIAADTDTAGSYVAEWQVTWAGGKQQTFPTLTFHSIEILADLDGV